MKVLVCVLLLLAAVAGQDNEEEEYYSECPVPNGKFADAVQCDRYYECKDSVLNDYLCPDGQAFDDSGPYPRCEFLFRVDCADRKELQPAQSTRDCERANGYYPDPSSCFKFFLCTGGIGYPQNCPANLVFNPETGTCTFADEANREGCTTEDLIGFTCPPVSTVINSAAANRFNNPRFAAPKDCRKYFVCIGGTKPRENSCGPLTVFNDVTKSCDDPRNVPECRNYYGPIEEEEKRPAQKIHITREPGSNQPPPIVRAPTPEVVQEEDNPFIARGPVEEKPAEEVEEFSFVRRPVANRPQFTDRRTQRPIETEEEIIHPVVDEPEKPVEVEEVPVEPVVPPRRRTTQRRRRPFRRPHRRPQVEEDI